MAAHARALCRGGAGSDEEARGDGSGAGRARVMRPQGNVMGPAAAVKLALVRWAAVGAPKWFPASTVYQAVRLLRSR